ncbi:transposase [Roseibium album]|uniref:transposase n=1 Tax=Roseibium album TaxID=311410 RepID=UPI0011875C60|nr:transposase [Roseibium album]
MFERLPDESFHYGDFPELSAGVGYFKDLIGIKEWKDRREAAAWHFYRSLVGEQEDPSGEGRFYGLEDLFGWYLFLGEALTDHPQNYEVFYGCRIVPVLAAIGRNLELIPQIKGFNERAKRLIERERSQPNGGLFEMLVAMAYARDGAKVAFKPEEPGRAKAYDLDVEVHGAFWAVECKRFENGDYVESERARKRELWLPATRLIIPSGRSIYAKVDFSVELSDVPDDYLVRHVIDFLHSGKNSNLWTDDFAFGVIGDLDLEPLQTALKNGYLLYPSPVYNKLLTGTYIRYDELNTLQKVKHAQNPHFIDKVDQAVVLRTRSLSEGAIEKKARDFKRKLFDANKQLPDDRPGIIHIGLEALGDDLIEYRRHEKIMKTINDFDPKGKPLSFIYWHYFAPEASPEETWAFDETFQWRGIRGDKRPLTLTSLILPPQAEGRDGVHWDGLPNKTFRSP